MNEEKELGELVINLIEKNMSEKLVIKAYNDYRNYECELWRKGKLTNSDLVMNVYKKYQEWEKKR